MSGSEGLFLFSFVYVTSYSTVILQVLGPQQEYEVFLSCGVTSSVTLY